LSAAAGTNIALVAVKASEPVSSAGNAGLEEATLPMGNENGDQAEQTHLSCA
jgi:hypothetical protein